MLLTRLKFPSDPTFPSYPLRPQCLIWCVARRRPSINHYWMNELVLELEGTMEIGWPTCSSLPETFPVLVLEVPGKLGPLVIIQKFTWPNFLSNLPPLLSPVNANINITIDCTVQCVRCCARYLHILSHLIFTMTPSHRWRLERLSEFPWDMWLIGGRQDMNTSLPDLGLLVTGSFLWEAAYSR